MNIATVLLNSEPVSMIRRHNGMISVVNKKLITSLESFLTKAPITPRDVRRRYSNGLDFDVVFKKGYRNRGICAGVQLAGTQACVDSVCVPLRKSPRVSLWEATH